MSLRSIQMAMLLGIVATLAVAANQAIAQPPMGGEKKAEKIPGPKDDKGMKKGETPAPGIATPAPGHGGVVSGAPVQGGVVSGTPIAGGCGSSVAGAPVASGLAAGGCGPTVSYRTVQFTEYVPQNYVTTRTVYRRVAKQETYTAYRCVSTPVTRTRQVTYTVRKPVVRQVTRTVYDRVPVTETRTVMKPFYSYRTETVMKTRRVDRGHYETVQVPAPLKTLCNRLRHMCSRDRCCNPCPPPPATRCVKRWVPCYVTVCCPVQVCRKVCEMRPCPVQVTTTRCVPRTVTCPVTEYVCVPQVRTETYTCQVTKQVPYTCTRTVYQCVPTQEQVTCCRLVPRTVCRKVPVYNTCAAPAADCCEASTSCCGGGGLFSGRLFNLMGRFRSGSSCCGMSSGCGLGGIGAAGCGCN